MANEGLVAIGLAAAYFAAVVGGLAWYVSRQQSRQHGPPDTRTTALESPHTVPHVSSLNLNLEQLALAAAGTYNSEEAGFLPRADAERMRQDLLAKLGADSQEARKVLARLYAQGKITEGPYNQLRAGLR